MSRLELFYPAGGSAIIAFAVSDDKGTYNMVMKSTFDSLDIEVTSIHYQKLRYRIANSSQQRNLVLRPDLKQLDMFTVKAQHIRQQGDTISYLVSRFANAGSLHRGCAAPHAGHRDRIVGQDTVRRRPH